MEYLILDIARILRRSGLTVSSQEVSDCLTLLKYLGTKKINKYTFYHLLNATMIKTPWGSDFALWLIELFFEPDVEISSDRLDILYPKTNSNTGQNLGSSGKGLPLGLMLDAVYKNNIDLLYALFQNLHLNLELHLENREEALLDFQQQSGWSEISSQIVLCYQEGKISAAEFQTAQAALEEWNNLLKDEIELQLIKNMSRDTLISEMRKRNPMTVCFLESDESHTSAMSQEIKKLARKLAVHKGRRRKIGSKGLISLNKSIKRAIQTGGVPLFLFKMQKKPAKPDLWILCDMSNSVSKFSYFMLMFVYAAQMHYAQIRSFFFVDLLMEVTDILKIHDWSNALPSTGIIRGYNLTGYSDYGNVLKEFNERYLPLLHKKTTVLILGDAKNNRHKDDGSEILSQIKEASANLYWLNPLSENLWNQDDCIMEKYRAHCTGGYACANIEQLHRFLTKL